MDEKIQRYNQRIQRIMFTPRKGANTARSSKSPISTRPTNLDKYLKYEHSTKIINNLIKKKQQQLLNYFFGTIRSTQIHLKNKILKLIGIEKVAKIERKVDFTVSIKVLAANLKQLYRKRFIIFVSSLKINDAPQSTVSPSPSISPINSKLVRIASQRQPKVNNKSGNTTVRNRNFTISQWDNKSVIQEQSISKGETQRYKQISCKNIIKFVKNKINLNFRHSFGKIQLQETILASQLPYSLQDVNLSQKQNKSLQNYEKIYQSSRICIILRKASVKFLDVAFNRMKKIKDNQDLRYNFKRKQVSFRLLKFMKRYKFKYFHLLFNSIKNIKKIKDIQTKQLAYQQSNKNVVQSPINKFDDFQNVNPLIKVDFYTFVDKFLKFMIIISKMLIPIKQAFIKIDHYASYSYNLQQSLKVAPRHFLLHSFAQIKQYSRQKQIQTTPNKAKSASVILQYLSQSIKDRLIQGFTHIKIISKERDLKIKIFPAKINIIESTKLFIMQRDTYTSQSVEQWNGIKSLIYSSKNQKQNLKGSRKRSSIFP